MSRAKSNVAIICNTFSASFVFRQTLIAALQKEERLSAVLSLADDKSKVSKTAKRVQTKTIRLSPRGVMEGARFLRATGTEICHGFTHAGNMAALILGIMLRMPVMMNITGMGRAFSATGLRNVFLRVGLLCFYASAQGMVRYVIVQNKDDARLIARTFLPWMRYKILRTNGSGIDPTFFQGVQPATIGTPDTHIRVGFFSRALPEKGVFDFYALANRHRARGDIAFYHLGHPGTGDLAPDRIEAHAKRQNLTYLSFQVDPRSWLLAMDIVVLPSNYREGFSRLCIEAMLAGKVIVARDTTGVRDHIISGQNGFLYATTDDLEQAFESALTADRAAIGDAAKRYALANFDVADVDKVYFTCYNDA